MKKVFILEGNRGDYDDRYSWIEGVFSTSDLLQEYQDEYLKHNEIIKKIPCPIDEEIYRNTNWYRIVSDEDYNKVEDWLRSIGMAESFKGFNIREMKIDRKFKPAILNL